MTENDEPLSEAELRNAIIHYTCLKNCYGQKGNAGACCMIADRDFIIGPITDAKEFLARLKKSTGKSYRYDEVFLEHKEGSRLFPERSAWQKTSHYPALRVKIDAAGKHPCIFHDDKLGCTVHEIRPQICRTYYCDHLKSVLSQALGE
jgi:Fe-S-cluster containining protein